jgi:nitroimidazol reductase NimA-like FMN-containing flavoprotein (pyridoxamine 5'-phosphate oxidase superfamily)
MKDLEQEVRNVIKSNHWLVLSTADVNGVPQCSVVVHASNGNVIYILSGEGTLKTRNIKANKHVGVTIPFRKNILHRLMRNVPPAEIHFRGEATILPYSDEEARRIYGKVMNYEAPPDTEQASVWIKIKPTSKVSCYGLGVSLLTMRKPYEARKMVQLSN